MFGVQVLVACVPEALYNACAFANVYTMQRILIHLTSSDSAQAFKTGGLIAAIALGFLGLMVRTNLAMT